MEKGRSDTMRRRGRCFGSTVSSTRSGGGDEPHGQDAGDVRVWFVERGDVENGLGSNHDEMGRSGEEGR